MNQYKIKNVVFVQKINFKSLVVDRKESARGMKQKALKAKKRKSLKEMIWKAFLPPRDLKIRMMH